MWGLITKRAHDAKIKALENARDWAVDSSNHWARQFREQVEMVAERDQKIADLEADLRAKNNRITNMQKDIDRMEAEANANARFVEVGKARLAALEKAKRRVVA